MANRYDKPGTRTKLQNTAIWGRKAERAISAENFRALVLNVSQGRTESSKELSFNEANKLIEEMGGVPINAGKRTRQRKAQQAGVVSLPSASQLELLRALATQRWGAAHAEKTLAKFCEARSVLGHAQPRTSKEAVKVIEILKRKNALETEEAA